MNIIIGLGYRARTGKDTFFNILSKNQDSLNINVYRLAFADALKDEVYNIVLKPNGIQRSILDSEYKEQFRVLLQWWGTEFRRNLDIPGYKSDENYWVSILKDKIQNIKQESSLDINVYCVCDVRFISECEMIKNLGGILIKVNRKTNNNVPSHISEAQLEPYAGWDYILDNYGTIEEYEENVKSVMDHILGTSLWD